MATLHDSLFGTARRFPDRVAVCSQAEEMTFEAFALRVEHLGGALESLGLKKGDRISLISRNRADYLTYHFATSMMGIVLHVMNTRHVTREWLWAMNDAGSSALIVDETHAHAIADLRAGCTGLRFVAGIGTVSGADHATDALVDAGRTPRQRPRIAPDDPVMLIYTSGTTGLPKGCLQTQLGSTTIDGLTADAVQATERDVYMAVMPYFHQAGMIRSRAIMLRGGANVVPEDLNIESVADLMVEKGVTVTMLVSAKQSLTLLDKATNQGRDFTSLRLLISGGGTGRKTMKGLKLICDTLGCDFMGIWGQTECTGPVTVVHGATAFENPFTCGRPMPGIELQVWNDDKQVLPAGEIGEIMVRSDTTAHYWNNPEANAALYTGRWLHTGDLGRLDERGYLYFEGRKKDLIKTGGENVYPLEVETVLSEHPAVREVAVIGLSDPEWGEAVAAVVVSVDGRPVFPAELREFCRDKIAGYKNPAQGRDGHRDPQERDRQGAQGSPEEAVSGAGALETEAMSNDKVVITCALTGVLTDPARFNVPVTPEEMADAAQQAYDEGASVLHTHFRAQQPGAGAFPTWDPEEVGDILGAIRQRVPEMLICMSTGVIGKNISGPCGHCIVLPPSTEATSREMLRLAEPSSEREAPCTSK